MNFYSVFDPEFHPYGRVVQGLDDAAAEILAALEKTPLPKNVGYVPEEPILQQLPAMEAVRDHLYGGMPVELGWCNGHNTRLNALEYHRDSEFVLPGEDLILLMARKEEIRDGKLDTAKVKAFRVPKGVLVETYATTLHFAPCHADPEKGFKMMVALPRYTNTEKPDIPVRTDEDRLLWARNKWLLAHPDSDDARQGAYIGLVGENIDIAPWLG